MFGTKKKTQARELASDWLNALEKMLSLTNDEKLLVMQSNDSPYVYHFISTLVDAPMHNLDRKPTKYDKAALWNIKSMYLGGISSIDALPIIRRNDKQYAHVAKEASADAYRLLEAKSGEELTTIIEKFITIAEEWQQS